jgi:hypothetical protein
LRLTDAESHASPLFRTVLQAGGGDSPVGRKSVGFGTAEIQVPDDSPLAATTAAAAIAAAAAAAAAATSLVTHTDVHCPPLHVTIDVRRNRSTLVCCTALSRAI